MNRPAAAGRCERPDPRHFLPARISRRVEAAPARWRARTALRLLLAIALAACAPGFDPPPADLVLINGRVYTFAWGEPDRNGRPAEDAPYGPGGWHPDATAIAVEHNAILYIGDDAGIGRFIGEHTRVVDLDGATVLPGLIDAHTHVFNLGATLEQIDLVGVATEEEAVARVVARAGDVAPGTWLIGYGWDEGAWADDYPDKTLLTARLPNHPVLMRGLHSFAVWGNQAALDAAGITAQTVVPDGGRLPLDDEGEPTGLLLDRATALLTEAVPEPGAEQLEQRFLLGLEEMAESGYTMVHEAGLDSRQMRALENLAASGRLPVRVYAMLSARDDALLRQWMEWGPDVDGTDNLMTRSVKAFYDGALGSRGARLLEDYADMPGHRGVSGDDYGFDEELVAEMMAAGFQANIHAIGDAGNRETLDFFDRALSRYPAARQLRHRIEHAQVVQPGDFWRFRTLGLIASVQPPHAMEDRTWVADRIGEQRAQGAYAWRTFRQIRVPLAFSSDLPGSDHDIFYGLLAAMTRRDKELMPAGGWRPEQRMTPEEAIRGYTSWAAFASFVEDTRGSLAIGLWADMTVMNIDPLVVGSTDADRLAQGRIVMTIVGGQVIYESS